MTLLTGPNRTAAGEPNADVLFAEARRRRRRRRVAAVVVVVLAALGGWLISTGGGGTAKPLPTNGSRGGSPVVPNVDKRPATISAFNGQLDSHAMAIGPGGGGLVWLNGYPGHANRQLAWLGRTTDAGRTWAAGRAGDAITADSAVTGQQFTFVGPGVAVGYDAPNGIWVTTDSGRAWRHRLRGWTVSDVEADGRGVAVAAEHCVGSDSSCRLVILRAGSVMGRFAPLPVQPPRSGWYQFVSGAATTTIAYSSPSVRDWRFAIAGGTSWTTRALPCQSPYTSASPDLISSGSTLWTTCLTKTRGRPPVERTYRSTDDGVTWNGARARTFTNSVSLMSVTDQRSAVETTGQMGGFAMARTTDGGRRWRDIHGPPFVGNGFVDDCVAASNTIWCAVEHSGSSGSYFTVDRTTDFGRSWRSSVVPVAPNLPRGATKATPVGRPAT
jgi:hypothetical protein